MTDIVVDAVFTLGSIIVVFFILRGYINNKIEEVTRDFQSEILIERNLRHDMFATYKQLFDGQIGQIWDKITELQKRPVVMQEAGVHLLTNNDLDNLLNRIDRRIGRAVQELTERGQSVEGGSV
jgi:deoxyadenosine/deoxycytidine kinase